MALIGVKWLLFCCWTWFIHHQFICNCVVDWRDYTKSIYNCQYLVWWGNCSKKLQNEWKKRHGETDKEFKPVVLSDIPRMLDVQTLDEFLLNLCGCKSCHRWSHCNVVQYCQYHWFSFFRFTQICLQWNNIQLIYQHKRNRLMSMQKNGSLARSM